MWTTMRCHGLKVYCCHINPLCTDCSDYQINLSINLDKHGKPLIPAADLHIIRRWGMSSCSFSWDLYGRPASFWRSKDQDVVYWRESGIFVNAEWKVGEENSIHLIGLCGNLKAVYRWQNCGQPISICLMGSKGMKEQDVVYCKDSGNVLM